MKNLLVLVFCLFMFSGLHAQSRKQLKKAFLSDKKVKLITYYCKSKKRYDRRVKRLLRIIDSFNCDYGFRCRFEEVRKIENVTFDY